MRETIGAPVRIAVAIAALTLNALAQQYPSQDQYPPAGGPYPPPPGQYPPAQQQPQYPPAPGQYPAQGQYPPYPPQGQYPQAPPPYVSPQQVDGMVQRIALYPDPLLAQILTASTFWDQIPQAAGWANQHSYLHGQQLAQAIQDDRLPWDPSVLALVPFPQVLNMMASDPGWTQALGSAVLSNRPMVMDSVQRMRQEALSYGYLQSNQYVQVVNAPGAIEIIPVNPEVVYVPVYSPAVVFVRPRPGFFVSAAIRFGPGITIGAAFAPFGWAHPYLGWREHTIFINNRPWVRTWANRTYYAHPYEGLRRPVGPPVERHEEHGRDRDRHDDRQ
jgi:hypothetical protein